MNEYININNNININPYKINSFNVKKNLNLQKTISGIKNGIGVVSDKIKETDSKIKKFIKKNIPRKKFNHLKININPDINKYNIRNLSYQYSSSNSIKNNDNHIKNCYSLNNIFIPTNQTNNNISSFNNFNNSTFSKSSNNFNKIDSRQNSYQENKDINYIYKTNIHTYKPKEINLLNKVLQKQIIEIRLQLYESEKKCEKFYEIINNLKKENNILNKNLVELNKESNSYSNVKNQMNEEIIKLNEIINEKNCLIQNLNTQLELMINMQSFQNGENDQNKKNENINDINEYYNDINYFRIKNADIKKDINNLKEEFDQLINHSSKRKNKKEKKVKINNSNNKDKKHNTNNNNSNYKSIYENEILLLKQENKEINELYNKIKIENDNLIEENKKIKNDYIELNVMKEDNIKLSKINQQLNGINNALKTQNEELDIENKNNLSQIKKLISLNEEQKNQKIILEKNLEEKKQEIENLLSKINLVQKENEININKNKEIIKEEENKIIKKLNDEINKLNNIIKNKEKEIIDYKLINNQLIDDNTKKQEKISELMENSQQESFLLTLENLKQEIKEYKNKIKDLTNKNNELYEKLKKNNTMINKVDKNYFNKKKFLEADEEFDSNEFNNNFNNKFNLNNFSKSDNREEKKISMGGWGAEQGLGEGEGEHNFQKFKERIKEYKEEINLLLMQINTLKDEIKQCQIQLNKPIVKNYDEFVKLFNLAFTGYKPFRKDQNEAFELIKQKFILIN